MNTPIALLSAIILALSCNETGLTSKSTVETANPNSLNTTPTGGGSGNPGQSSGSGSVDNPSTGSATGNPSQGTGGTIDGSPANGTGSGSATLTGSGSATLTGSGSTTLTGSGSTGSGSDITGSTTPGGDPANGTGTSGSASISDGSSSSGTGTGGDCGLTEDRINPKFQEPIQGCLDSGRMWNFSQSKCTDVADPTSFSCNFSSLKSRLDERGIFSGELAAAQSGRKKVFVDCGEKKIGRTEIYMAQFITDSIAELDKIACNYKQIDPGSITTGCFVLNPTPALTALNLSVISAANKIRLEREKIVPDDKKAEQQKKIDEFIAAYKVVKAQFNNTCFNL